MKIYVALPLVVLLSACGSPTAQPEKAVQADAENVYGVDGMETVGEVTFLPASSLYNAYAKGLLFCYDHQVSDGTCQHVEGKRTVTRDTVNGWSIWREHGGGTKISSVFQTVVKGKYLCTMTTEQSVRAGTAYRSFDNKAKIIATDVALSPEQHAEWHERLVRASQNDIGNESCYRYSVVARSPEGLVDVMREHRFIDGIEQVGPHPVFVKTFTANSDLFLRPMKE